LNNRARLTDWLLLLAVPAFFFLWRLSAFGLVGADEPRYAQVAREMFERGDWITPTLGRVPWLEKPPLYYWQAMVAYKLFGISDWAARLPSVFDAFLLMIAVYWFLERFRRGIELDGALICATSAGIVGFSRAASTDMPLTALFSVAMLAWCAWLEAGDRKHLVGFYAFLALATLAKGPVAPFLAMAIIGIFAAANRSAKLAWRTLSIPGILIFCAIGLPWYVLVELRNPQFFHQFIVEHNLARFGTNLYHHPEPFWYYIPVTLLGWAPWSILAVAALLSAARRVRRAGADSLSLLFLIWIAVVVLFFSTSQSKLPGYVLPAMVPAAVLLARFLGETSLTADMPKSTRLALALLQAALLAGLVFCALVVQNLILRHRVDWGAAKAPLLGSALVAIGSSIALMKFKLPAWRAVTLVATIVALAIALRFGAQPLDETLSTRPIARELAKIDPHLPVAVFLVPRETEFGLAFYRNQVIDRYELGQVPRGEHLVVAAHGYLRGVAKAAGRRVVYLGDFTPQDFDLFYVPAR
jgi:4-amino-4-deoxy-L-arabinose transferase-like glycosyltransferase